MTTTTLPGQWIAGAWIDPADDLVSTNPAASGPGGREMGQAAEEFFTQTRTAYLDRELAP